LQYLEKAEAAGDGTMMERWIIKTFDKTDFKNNIISQQVYL